MLVEESKYIAYEKVEGNEQGITKVKSITVLNEDGSLTATSEYFKNGAWIEGQPIRRPLSLSRLIRPHRR